MDEREEGGVVGVRMIVREGGLMRGAREMIRGERLILRERELEWEEFGRRRGFFGERGLARRWYLRSYIWVGIVGVWVREGGRGIWQERRGDFFHRGFFDSRGWGRYLAQAALNIASLERPKLCETFNQYHIFFVYRGDLHS